MITMNKIISAPNFGTILVKQFTITRSYCSTQLLNTITNIQRNVLYATKNGGGGYSDHSLKQWVHGIKWSQK